MERPTLVLIDDDPIVATIMGKMLADCEIEFVSFTDPRKGMDFVIENRPKIVVIDFYMPDLTGQDIVIKFSENKMFQYSSFFMITGQNLNSDDKIRYMTLGFEQFLKKPFTKEELYQAIKSVCPEFRAHAKVA